MATIPRDLDLAELTRALAVTFAGAAPIGFVRGRTALRDAVKSKLACSDLEAEQIVDTLVARGFLRFTGDPKTTDDPGATWTLQA